MKYYLQSREPGSNISQVVVSDTCNQAVACTITNIIFFVLVFKIYLFHHYCCTIIVVLGMVTLQSLNPEKLLSRLLARPFQIISMLSSIIPSMKALLPILVLVLEILFLSSFA
jgi:hypothetical protein